MLADLMFRKYREKILQEGRDQERKYLLAELERVIQEKKEAKSDAPLPEPRCGNCLFFKRYGPADTGLHVNTTGDCRANPPIHHVDGPFPTVKDDLWCARYQYDPDAKEPETPAPVPPPKYP